MDLKQLQSHHRGLITFCISLLSLDEDLLITYFASPAIKEGTLIFIERDFTLHAEERSRLRLRFVEDVDGGTFLGGTARRVLQDHYASLLSGEEPVTAIVSDVFAHQVVDYARAHGFRGETALWILMATPAIANFAQRGLQAKKSTESILCEVDGVPLQYSHESACMTTPLSSPRGKLSEMEMQALDSWLSGHTMLNSFSRRLLPKAAHQTQAKGDVLVVAPSFPPSFWNDKAEFPLDDPLYAFLAAQKPRSVLYISFGSLFFPSDQIIDVLLDALFAARVPFVFCLGAKMAGNMSAECRKAFEERIERSELAVWSDWVDQPLLLKHGAISFVLTHGGCNTFLEALICSLPMIVMPITADQAMSGNIVEQLGTGMQIWNHRDRLVGLEIASRPGFRVTGIEALRAELDDVFRRMKGEHGKSALQNAQKASLILRAEHSEDAELYAREFLSRVHDE